MISRKVSYAKLASISDDYKTLRPFPFYRHKTFGKTAKFSWTKVSGFVKSRTVSNSIGQKQLDLIRLVFDIWLLDLGKRVASVWLSESTYKVEICRCLGNEGMNIMNVGIGEHRIGPRKTGPVRRIKRDNPMSWTHRVTDASDLTFDRTEKDLPNPEGVNFSSD